MIKKSQTQTSALSTFIKEQCKGRTGGKLKEAEENFREYLLVLKEICERMDREDNAISDFDHSRNL